MCTAVTYKTQDFYFGRTLDLEYSYNPKVTVTPRGFEFNFRTKGIIKSRFAMIGMATAAKSFPLYYEASNERGLCMAGLNFPNNACYFEPAEDKDNIAPFEFIPWLLSQCASLEEARGLLERINLVNINFSPEYPLSPLHWIIADKTGAITVESVKDGLKIYQNPVGILTNNPPFDYHMTHLCDYMNLTSQPPVNRFCESISLSPYSKGMGTIGLPGDLSSSSRFVRAAFTKLNSVSGADEADSISQFFHILGSVAQTRGCAMGDKGEYVITRYTSCINADKGIYYYTTYTNNQITAVNMHKCNLDSDALITFDLVNTQQILWCT